MQNFRLYSVFQHMLFYLTFLKSRKLITVDVTIAVVLNYTVDIKASQISSVGRFYPVFLLFSTG
jgi:hypothetical protein